MRPGSAYKLNRPTLTSAAGRNAMLNSSPRHGSANRVKLFSDGTSIFLERTAEERIANQNSLVIDRYNLTAFPLLKTPEPTVIKLSCVSNNIQRLSDALLKLPCLQYLDISNNKLETLDGVTAFCPGLRVLKARNCLLTRISDLNGLAHLTYLDLGDNQLTGTLVVDFSSFPSTLQFLSLRNNKLSSIVCTKAVFPELIDFNLGGNRLDYIEIDPRTLPKLTKIDIGGNAVHDPLTLESLLLIPHLKLIILKHNSFCVPFEPLFTTRMSNQQIIQSFSDVFNRLSSLANGRGLVKNNAEDMSFLLLADFGDFRHYFVLRYKDPKRGTPQLSYSDVKIEKANFLLKTIHNLHSSFTFEHYLQDTNVPKSDFCKTLPPELLDDTLIYTTGKKCHLPKASIAPAECSDTETYSYYSTDEESIHTESRNSDRGSASLAIPVSKIPRPVSESAVNKRQRSVQFNSKTFIDDAASKLMKRLEITNTKRSHRSPSPSPSSKAVPPSSKSFMCVSKAETKKVYTASSVPSVCSDSSAANLLQPNGDLFVPQNTGPLFTPALFQTPKNAQEQLRSLSPLSVLTRPSTTGNPLLIGKELRELDIDTCIFTDDYDHAHNITKSPSKNEPEDLRSSVTTHKSPRIVKKDRTSSKSVLNKSKTQIKQRPTSASNVPSNRSTQSTTALPHALGLMNPRDATFIKSLKTRIVDYKVFPKRTQEIDDVVYEFTRLNDFYRLTNGTSGYLADDISRQPHGGIRTNALESANNPQSTHDIKPILELRPRKGKEIKDFSNPILSQEYEVFIVGVKNLEDVDLVGPLSTLLFKMIHKDPELFTMPSISVKEVNLIDMGYESREVDQSVESLNHEIGLIVVPIKISTSTMQVDVNYLTGNFIQAISFFKCNIDLYDFNNNCDLSQFIECIDVLDCGIKTLAQIQFISAFSRLRCLTVYDDITKRTYFRAACLYYCPTLEIINDLPVTDTDLVKVGSFTKRHGVFVSTHRHEVSNVTNEKNPSNSPEMQANRMIRQVTASVDGIRRSLCCSMWMQFKQ